MRRIASNPRFKKTPTEPTAMPRFWAISSYPSVHVNGYTRADGTTVLPYYRTPANDTVTDNLSYRGFGTVRVPKSSYDW
jgi:hypothetical protein